MPYVTNLKGTKQVKVSLSKYAIDWNSKSPSQFQKKIKDFLAKYWSADIGVCEEFRISGSLLRVDFLHFGKRIAIEASGQQHFEYTPFFHGNNPLNYMQSIKRDDAKRQWLEKNGFKVIELIEEDLPHLSPEFIKEKFGVDII